MARQFVEQTRVAVGPDVPILWRDTSTSSGGCESAPGEFTGEYDHGLSVVMRFDRREQAQALWQRGTAYWESLDLEVNSGTDGRGWRTTTAFGAGDGPGTTFGVAMDYNVSEDDPGPGTWAINAETPCLPPGNATHPESSEWPETPSASPDWTPPNDLPTPQP